MTLSVFVIGAFISLNIIIISPIISTIKSRRRVFAVLVLTPFVFFVLDTSWALLSCKLIEDKSNEKVRFTQNEYEKNCFCRFVFWSREACCGWSDLWQPWCALEAAYCFRLSSFTCCQRWGIFTPDIYPIRLILLNISTGY